MCVLCAFGALLGAPLFWWFDQERLGLLLPITLAPMGGSCGIMAWLKARRELTLMSVGLLHPSGEWDLRFARDRGRTAALTCIVIPILYLLIFVST
jgi:hypothetical protein